MKHNKKIDKIIRDKFFIKKNAVHFDHYCLCDVFTDTEYASLWREYWTKTNNKHYDAISDYLILYEMDVDTYDFECLSLLRLLVVEDFKRYVNEL